jgi:hypothetical protein
MIESGLNDLMAKSILGLLLIAIVSYLPGGYASAQQASETPLTNAAVIKLVKAGFKEKTIISIINSRPNRFILTTDQLIQLKHSGVSENVILAMLSLREYQPDDEAWADDSFFRRSAKQSVEDDPLNAPDSGTGIFGSSNGSKSQSRSRGERGGNETEGNVTGSATVRIIRPPSEAGGAPPKLERTPTLNNEGVIRLVEAGFSEGTIIKRIEDSPVEFDLSPDKVAELHKRRVSDPIIAAMTVAMSDGPVKPLSQPERN